MCDVNHAHLANHKGEPKGDQTPQEKNHVLRVEDVVVVGVVEAVLVNRAPRVVVAHGHALQNVVIHKEYDLHKARQSEHEKYYSDSPSKEPHSNQVGCHKAENVREEFHLVPIHKVEFFPASEKPLCQDLVLKVDQPGREEDCLNAWNPEHFEQSDSVVRP